MQRPINIFQVEAAPLDENDEAYSDYMGTGVAHFPAPKRQKMSPSSESDDEDQGAPEATKKAAPAVEEVEPKSVDIFASDDESQESLGNYESAREELEEEMEEVPRKKKKVVIEDEDEEDEVVADSQEQPQLCYETDVSDELDESFDTDIDRTPMKQVEVVREHIDGKGDVGESAGACQTAEIPEEFDTLTKELLQQRAFTPPPRSPNNVIEPAELDTFQTPEASSRRPSVKTPQSHEKLADTTMIDLSDVPSQSTVNNMKSLDLGSSLQKRLESAKKPKPEAKDEHTLQSPSMFNKSGPLQANITKSSEKEGNQSPKKEYVEFEVAVRNADGSIGKIKYEELLKTKNLEWFSGPENVSFRPDFRKPDYDYHKNFIYCEIPEYELGIDETVQDHPKKPKKIPQPWRQGEDSRSKLRHTQRRVHLKEYKNTYLTGGYQLFVSLLEMCSGIDTSMTALHKYYHEERARTSVETVLEKFRSVVHWALKAKELFKSTPEIFFLSGDVESATFSQEQCAALVSWMFLFKSRPHHFEKILTGKEQVHVEKLRFLFTYFEAALSIPPGGTVSFRRIRSTEPRTEAMYDTHADFNVKILDCDLRIEETALCTQVDFANKNIGGGVLRAGCVQEEIRFLMCPEMMVAMMMMEGPLADDEAISIVGAQAFSSYSGYGHTTKWEPLNERDSRQNDPSFRDHYGRLRVETIAIDAIDFTASSSQLVPLRKQLTESNIIREYRKAVAGFSSQGSDFIPPIVSGWWGCGAFSGHKPLKVLIQACAAAKSGRELWICKFGDDSMARKTRRMFDKIRKVNLTPGQIMRMLLSLDRPNKPSDTFVYDALATLIASSTFEVPTSSTSSHSQTSRSQL